MLLVHSHTHTHSYIYIPSGFCRSKSILTCCESSDVDISDTSRSIQTDHVHAEVLELLGFFQRHGRNAMGPRPWKSHEPTNGCPQMVGTWTLVYISTCRISVIIISAWECSYCIMSLEYWTIHLGALTICMYTIPIQVPRNFNFGGFIHQKTMDGFTTSEFLDGVCVSYILISRAL